MAGPVMDSRGLFKQRRIEPEPRCGAKNEGASAEAYAIYAAQANDEVTPHRARIRAKESLVSSG